MKDSDLSKSLGKDFGDFAKTDNEEEYEDGFTSEDKKSNEARNEEHESKKSEPSILLIIPFILAIIGLSISFIKIKSKAIFHIVISGIIFFSLFVFGILLKNNKELSMLDSFDNGASGLGLKEGMIKVSLGGAFYISCVISLLLVFYFGVITYLNKQNILLEKDSLEAKYKDFNEEL